MKRTNAGETPGVRYLAFLRTRNQTAEERWSSKDLRAIFDHQLDTRLDCDLPEAASNRNCIGNGAGGSDPGRCQCLTFRDLLRCAAPSPLLLRLLKEFAKKSVRVESTLPPDVARYLYVLCALRARIHGIAGISTLTNASVAREASRCLTFAWPSNEAREMLRSSLVEANKKRGGDATGGPAGPSDTG